MKIDRINSYNSFGAKNLKLPQISKNGIPTSKLPNIEDFFLDGEPKILSPKVEKTLNEYIEKYADEIAKKEAIAIEQSKRIFLVGAQV